MGTNDIADSKDTDTVVKLEDTAKKIKQTCPNSAVTVSSRLTKKSERDDLGLPV